jgi:hypothetical protein
MSTSSVGELGALVAAYRTLDVEFRASPIAIRHRYRELARAHHPDKWPQGPSHQKDATSRMREINAAYLRIRRAPLRHHPSGYECFQDHVEPERRTRLDRPVSVSVETTVRFVGGILVGAVVVVLAKFRAVARN